jgi:hypothetical protein
MENKTNPGSRQRSACLIHPLRRRGTLRDARTFLACCYICFGLLPALLGACRKEQDPTAPDAPEPPAVVTADSVLTRIRIRTGHPDVSRLDVFLYASDGTRSLEKHLSLDRIPDELGLLTLPGEKLAVVIANSPRKFNLKALERYDAMEQLAFSFSDDNPDRPVMGGSATTDGQCAEICLEPLLCRIVLTSVSNTMDGYDLLENPRVRLLDIPDTAEILRRQDFRPPELIDAGPWTPLPCDIGFFPLEPHLSLWCYPNDTPESVLGVLRPTLEFACEILGQTCSFEVPLPPLPRGCTKEIDLTIDGPGNHLYKIR